MASNIPRRRIREAVKDLMLGADTLSGVRVFTNPSTPTWRDQLPAMLIYTRSEASEEFNTAPRRDKRELELAIEIVVEGIEDEFSKEDDKPKGEDLLDTLIEQIECALYLDDTLGCDEDGNAVADNLQIDSIDFDYVRQGQRPTMAATITLSVRYFRFLPIDSQKQGLTAPFKKLDVDWNVGHHNLDEDEKPDFTNTEAEDEIDLPQT